MKLLGDRVGLIRPGISGETRVAAVVLFLFAGLLVSSATLADLPTTRVDGESGAVVESGCTVELCGSVEAQEVRSTTLLVDGREASSKAGNGPYCLAWDTKSSAPGTHYLETVAIRGNGTKKVVDRVELELVQGAPVSLSVPPSVRLGAPLKVQVQSACGFSAKRARLYVDSVASKTVTGLQDGCLEWATENVASGGHVLRVAAWDGNGRVAYSHSVSVSIPKRLDANVSESVAATSDSPDIKMEVMIPEGLVAKKLTALCDGKIVVDLDHNESVLKWSALELESGKHEVSVELVDSAGNSYSWGPRVITLDNRYKAEMAAKAAAEKAAAEAAEKARDEKIKSAFAADAADEAARNKEKEKQKRINDWVNSTAFHDPSQRGAVSRSTLAKSGGTVGCVHGMSVLVMRGVREMGTISTMTAKAKLGTGLITINATDTDSYFDESVLNVRKFIENYFSKAGYKVDWKKYDIDVHFQNTRAHGGDSAGAAMATAIISAVLNVPVRNEVVITGAIDPDGTIEPVGGVDLKAAAALKNPSILTVIVPSFQENVYDVLDLPPDMLVGHRIIAAENMDEVLRESLVGYDRGALAAASALFVQGLALFRQGKADEAVEKLGQAYAYTPEDLTIPVWIGAIKLGLIK